MPDPIPDPELSGLAQVKEFARLTLEHISLIAPEGSNNMAHKYKERESAGEKHYSHTKKLSLWVDKASDPDLKRDHLAITQLNNEIKYKLLADGRIKDGLDGFYLQCKEGYDTVVESKTGVCSQLAEAAIKYLLANLKYQGVVRCFNTGKHSFIVLNCPNTWNVKDREIDLLKKDHKVAITDLPEDALILDPWIRCKFEPQKAMEYWKDTRDLFKQDEEISCKQIGMLNGAEFKADLAAVSLSLTDEYLQLMQKAIEGKKDILDRDRVIKEMIDDMDLKSVGLLSVDAKKNGYEDLADNLKLIFNSKMRYMYRS